MKRHLITNRTHLVIIMVVMLAACNNPTLQKDSPTKFENSVPPTIVTVAELESPRLPMVMPVQLGCVWFNTNGEVIGIIFSLDQGDYFYSKDGTHSGFIHLNQVSQHNNEKQVSNGFSHDRIKKTSIAFSIEKEVPSVQKQ
jgi:hypothetical protein